MKTVFTVIILILNILLASVTYAQDTGRLPEGKKLPPLTGKIQENDTFTQGSMSGENPTGFIKDSLSGTGISGAVVSIPDSSISTVTKPDGSFKINNMPQNGNFILSVKKDGYLPFALNAKKDDFSRPFVLHIKKQHGELVIDSDLHHLGDNNFSEMSANAGSFRMPSQGPVYMKEFYVENIPPKGMILRIGSIIGLDTMASRELGQSKIDTFSTPLSIYINSVKIAEISVNADNKIIPINSSVLKAHSNNLLVLQTGINQLYQLSGGIDYDDIEFMNIILEQID